MEPLNQSLQSQNEHYRALVERLQFSLQSAGIGTWDLDTLNNTVTWDTRCRELFGVDSDDELTYQDVLKCIHPEDVAKVDEAVAKAIDPTSNGSYDIRYRTLANKDQSMRWVHCTGHAYLNNEGQVYRFSGIAQDITVEVLSRQEQERLLWMIDHSTDFISLSEWDGTLTYLNDAGQKMMGFDNLEDAKRHHSEYLVQDEVPLIKEVNIELEKHDKWSGTLHYKNFRTGERIPAKVNTLLFRDKITGKPAGRASVVRDLRPELDARAALSRSEDKFDFVTDFMPQQVWTAMPNGMLDFVNKQGRDYFGKPVEELMGANWQYVVHPDDFERAARAWENALSTGCTYETEFRLKGKDNSWRWHLARAIPFRQNGEIIKWFGTNTDIEEQKRTLERKDEFISVASHELKTPMTSLKASLQFMNLLFQKDLHSEKIPQLLVKANSNLDKLSHLVEDLLNVTKLEEGQLVLNRSEFNLSKLVYESCEHVRLAGTHEIRTTVDAGITLNADKHRLDQVLVNLINNAVKYAPGSSVIVITAVRNPGVIKVTVQDFGIGVPAEKIMHLFERYYRVDNAGNQFSGLGLGLYISNEIIQRHGGSMGVVSEEGKGSTFWFEIPDRSSSIYPAQSSPIA